MNDMDLLSAPLSFTVPTLVEWRRLDGTLLDQCVVAPNMVGTAILTEPDLWLLVLELYDIYAKPLDNSADWQHIYQVDANNRTVARFDL